MKFIGILTLIISTLSVSFVAYAHENSEHQTQAKSSLAIDWSVLIPKGDMKHIFENDTQQETQKNKEM